MGRLKLAMLVIGGVLVFMGYQEMRLSGIAKAERQEITAKELLQNGYGDNAHVKVTSILPVQSLYVYVEKKNKWETVWLPAVPMNGKYVEMLKQLPEDTSPENIPAPKNIGIILKLTDARDEKAVDRYSQLETIEGLVLNEIESIGSDEINILKEQYPSVDFKKCLIIEPGRSPKSSGFIAGFIGLGLVLMGLAAFLTFGGKKPKKNYKRNRSTNLNNKSNELDPEE